MPEVEFSKITELKLESLFCEYESCQEQLVELEVARRELVKRQAALKAQVIEFASTKETK